MDNQTAVTVKKQQEIELREILESYKDSYNLLEVSDKDKISIEFLKLCEVRGEKLTDYNFKYWLEHWQQGGYTVDQILAMIECGKELEKFGSTKLAIGDLIVNWKKKLEDDFEGKPIEWKEFIRILKIYEQKNMDIICKLVGHHITVDEYFKNKKYYDNQFELVYSKVDYEVKSAEQKESEATEIISNQSKLQDALKAERERMREHVLRIFDSERNPLLQRNLIKKL